MGGRGGKEKLDGEKLVHRVPNRDVSRTRDTTRFAFRGIARSPSPPLPLSSVPKKLDFAATSEARSVSQIRFPGLGSWHVVRAAACIVTGPGGKCRGSRTIEKRRSQTVFRLPSPLDFVSNGKKKRRIPTRGEEGKEESRAYGYRWIGFWSFSSKKF